MIFQVFATAVLAGVILYAWSQARMAPAVAATTIVIGLGGEYLVLFPNHAMAIARFVGIGRGADLINYLWMLLSLVVVLNLHLKLRAANARLVALTRALALEDAVQPRAASDGTRA
jgi:small membrane protein